jgi:ribosomal protein L40E
MFCRKCGEENPDNAVFCRNCGERLKEEEVKKAEVIE